MCVKLNISMAGLNFKMFKEIQILEKQSKILFLNNCFPRLKHSNEGLKFQPYGQTSSKNYFHKSSDYPATKQLPLPSNIKELNSEKLKFSPQRSRDISGSFISSSTAPSLKAPEADPQVSTDDRTECYDCSGNISLSSVMQTNVPFPFTSKGKPVHLNMPGGQWGQKDKYVSEDLNNTHHTNAKQFQFSSGGSFVLARKTGIKNSYLFLPETDPLFNNSLSFVFSIHANQLRDYCTEKNKVEITPNLDDKKTTNNVAKLSNKEKLKAAIKDYGVVVVVFHVGISLISLGCCYLIIASGIDLPGAFKNFGVEDGAAAAGNAAHFIIAYALHKSLAPGRIAITLTAVPFVVRKLRKIGLLKTPQPKPQ